MKIFFLTSTYYPSIGGVEVGIHNLSLNFSKLGHRVYVVCPWQGKFIPNKRLLPYKLITLPPRFFYFVRFLEYFPVKLFYFIYYFLLNLIYRPDFWHISMSYPAGFSFLEFANFSKVPYLVRSVGIDIQINKESNYGYRINKKVDNLFTNKFRYFSNHVAASSCLEYEYIKLGVNKNQVHRIPNGVDLKKFNINPLIKYKKYSEFINLISVGRNEPKKNYLKLIESFQILQAKSNKKFKLKIIGSKVNSLKKYLDLENIKNIELIEPDNYQTVNEFYDLPHEDIIKAYLNADIFVFSSLLESFGIVVLEAMAAGLPIVAFDVLGVNELVENKLNGKLVEINNINEFANAILEISNENEIKRMSQNSIDLSKKYDWANIAKKYLKLYLKIIREK